MIKVNLLKNRGVEGAASPGAGMDFGDFGGEVQVSPKEVAVKLLCIIGFAGGMMVYESSVIDELNIQLANLKRQDATVQTEVTEKRNEAGKAEIYQKEIQEIEKKLGIIKELSKTRLLEIRSLDLIQTLVPEKLWLVNISYKGDEYIIRGASVSETVLNQFIGNLEKTGFFKNVILLRSSEKKEDKESVREFVISSSLESDG